MNPTNSILVDIRTGLGLPSDSIDFDTELLMHINSAIGELNQNGIGLSLMVTDDALTWADLQNPAQSELNDEYFKVIPLFITLSTKLLFDPPPPSSVQYHQSSIDKLLWRLKIAYEEPLTTTTTSSGDW